MKLGVCLFKRLVVLVAIIVSLFFCDAAVASPVGRLVSTKQLTSQVGWAASEYRLFWTTDGGKRWSDITPTVETKRVASVSFVDPSTGWVLFSDNDQINNSSVFDLASTSNAGATWTVRPLKPPIPPDYILATGGEIEFVDSVHGWIGLGTQGNSPACVLLGTEDGGKTWQRDSLDCGSGRLHFATVRDGWTTNKDSDEIYATHDGGKSWQEFSLKAPAQAHSATSAVYGMPEFSDNNHGFLPVTFWGGPGVRSVLVLFATNDGGRTWNMSKSLPLQMQTTGGEMFPSTVADSTWVTIAASQQTLSLTLNAVPLNGANPADSQKANIESVVKLHGQHFTRGNDAERLSFVSRTQGWVMVSTSPCAVGLNGCILLLSTSDGGATWADITPSETKGKELTLIRRADVFPSTNKSDQVRSSVRVSRRSATTNPNISVHLAFDISYVTTITNMLVWWNNSPYFDTSVYLPGSANRGKDNNLTVAWVNAIRNEGWGMIPIWFGLQSSCVQNKNITKFFSTDPIQAKAQGIAEADAAVASATSLGIAATIIYKDIEAYSSSTGTCHGAVIAFLGGWTQEIHQKLGTGGLAGVYGNPIAAQNDFTQVQPPPDDIWISKWDNRRTIWGLATLQDLYWPVDQRIHQYFGSGAPCGYAETWGGLKLCIDPNIEDATIVTNSGWKFYNYTYSNLDYPSYPKYCTLVFGMNNVNNSGDLPALAGQVWPNDGDSDCNNDVGGGGPTSTFVEWKGNYQIIPGTTGQGQYSALAYANSINDSGQTVGWFYNSQDSVTDFIAAPPFTSFTDLTCTSGYPVGINDDGQIVEQSPYGSPSFIAQSPTSGCSQLPSQLYQVSAINGQTQLVGYSNAGPWEGWLYDAGSTGNILDFAFSTQTETFANSINNDGNIVGYYSPGGYPAYFFFFDYETQSFNTFSGYPDYGAQCYCTDITGINDAGQIVGWYVDSTGSYRGWIGIPTQK